MNKRIIEKYALEFEKAFNSYIPQRVCNYSILIDSMRYSFLLGGKRIRPIILMEFYRICGGKDNKALPFAVALEMIHTYSLIHDDLPCMDDDDMRRGKPSNHIEFGEDIALLAGDGLLTHAFYIASQVKDIEPKLCLKAINVLSELSGISGMIGGQVIDLLNEDKRASAETINEINLLKTGALISAAAKIGVILADGSEEMVEYAEAYGTKLGLAFQIMDDILDAVGDEKVLGKPIHSDEKNQKSTYVSLYGIEKCHEMVKNLTDEAISCLKNISVEAGFLEELTRYLANRKN
ncbi:MAG: polyprenyl synthetase family protein [Ruminococcaceae bacterium]|nr:polyprenyl synthetase family protein [Oscillospiraceae bacterium]